MRRGNAKTRVGVVLSDKMDKTVIVDVIQIVNHPTFKKPIKRNSKFKAHDEKNECRIGDKVLIIESRPLSKTKKWRVSKVLERSIVTEKVAEEISNEGVGLE
ncbi:MAG: 30S ribosomal protein S17 [Thermodesulfobacteriota bacterium]